VCCSRVRWPRRHCSGGVASGGERHVCVSCMCVMTCESRHVRQGHDRWTGACKMNKTRLISTPRYLHRHQRPHQHGQGGAILSYDAPDEPVEPNSNGAPPRKPAMSLTALCVCQCRQARVNVFLPPHVNVFPPPIYFLWYLWSERATLTQIDCLVDSQTHIRLACHV